MNYYNENDPKACAWLAELMREKLIPEGKIDARSITDVQPNDLEGFTQCHFFAGIGGWALALQLAGWPESRPAWTGSCPCQPFSVSGQGKGESDERHLWPEMFRLIAKRKPPVVFGEQVASPLALRWFDGIHADLEGSGYAVGSSDLCAAGVNAPHIRQRLYWLADSTSNGCERARQTRETQEGREPRPESSRKLPDRFEGSSNSCGLGDAQCSTQERFGQYGIKVVSRHEESDGCDHSNPWSRFDVIACRDGKNRRIEPGSFPLVAGLPKGMGHSGYPGLPFNPKACAEGRVMRLRGYGNAIVPQVAAKFIEAYMSL